MTLDERIDAALDAILVASGGRKLNMYTTPATIEAMREAMRKIMADEYNNGVDGFADYIHQKNIAGK